MLAVLELNDPMEGVCWFHADTLPKKYIRMLYGGKASRVICSFSGNDAFKRPLVWGYYANGFKGIAIEIEVNCRQTGITKMNCASEVANIMNGGKTPEAVKRILTTKLCCWKHEDEYRYLCNGETGPRKIGRITAVYSGDAYEYLLGQFAAGSGKKAGEFYTPQRISSILSGIVTLDGQEPATGKRDRLNNVYDFTCGSGSLLLNVRHRTGSA